MKYYGDAEITGKAKVDGGALIKNGLTSSKIKADEILIGSWSPYDTPPDEDKSLNIRNGAQILGDVVFANGNFKVQPPEVDFQVPVNFSNNFIVNISGNSKDNFKIYNDTATNDTISTYSDWVIIDADYFHFNNKNGSTKIQYNTKDDNFLINSIFKSTGWGSIYADKIKVGNSYRSISYSNGVLTFKTS